MLSSMIEIVIDTNVFVSALRSDGGAARQVLRKALQGHYRPVLDVCGAPAQMARMVRPGMTVAVLGTGKSGMLCLAQARHPLRATR